jgi:hypothetical protein
MNEKSEWMEEMEVLLMAVGGNMLEMEMESEWSWFMNQSPHWMTCR